MPLPLGQEVAISARSRWASPSEQEQSVAKRRIAKRNIERLQGFRDKGELKEDLVSALQNKSSLEE